MTSPTAGPVLVVGEALVDVVHRAGVTTEHVGGSPANVAAGLARLGHPTSLATCIGDDARGRQVVGHLEAHGVTLTKGSQRPGRTSTAQAEIGRDGAATYTFDITWQPSLDAATTEAGHVHTGSLATVLEPGASAVVALLASAGGRATVSYDPNIRPDVAGDPVALRDGVEAVVARSDVVKASDEDAALLHPGRDLAEVVGRWLDLGAGLVVITRGPEGVTWASASGAKGSSPTRATSVADTVGAGDSFMAGLLSGLLDAGLLGGSDARARLRLADEAALAAAVDRGLTTSARTVERAGAYAPTRSEITAS